MTELNPRQLAAQDRLKDVARSFASQHGLRPDSIAWVEQYDSWWLTVTTPEHSVKMVFSLDELEECAEEGPGTKGAKLKIRNAFANLTM